MFGFYRVISQFSSFEKVFPNKTPKYFSRGALKMDAKDSGDADRVIRQIFGDSDMESNENLEFDEEEFEDNLPLACLLTRSEESEDEEQFQMPSDEEED